MQYLKQFLPPVILTFALLFILISLASLLIYFTPLHEGLIGPLGIVIAIVSCFGGGFYAGRKAGSRGLINGMIVGLVFVAVIIDTALINEVPFAAFAPKCACTWLAAACGGVFGVK